MDHRKPCYPLLRWWLCAVCGRGPCWEGKGARLVHVDNLNDLVPMGIARDAAEAEAQALRSEVDRLRAALREIADDNPRTCHPAYYERGLAAPDCQARLAGDDARRALGLAPQCRATHAKEGPSDD